MHELKSIKCGGYLRLFVLSTVCTMAGMVIAVECSWQRDMCEDIDLADITSVPVGARLVDDGGYALPKRSGESDEMAMCKVPPEWSEGGKCGALRVSGVLVDVETRKIAGAMGSYVYPSVGEGAFAVTNGVHAAVLAASGGKAMFTPLHTADDGAGTILYEWDFDGRRIELVVKCFVNERRQMAVCSWLHVKGDSIWCGFQQTKKGKAK